MPIGPLHSGPASNFPPKSAWKDFAHIFDVNKNEMHVAGDTPGDIENIKDACQKAGAAHGIEPRVIICIIMQESSGNVGVITTTAPDGSHSGGLMQAAGSPGFPGKHGLPAKDITDMIEAGTKHFKGNLQSVGGGDTAEHIYWALRLYNSGSLDKNNLSSGGGATNSYVSDVANRLTGAHH